MNKARLTKLAELLEKLPRERFDYKVWVGNDWKGATDLSCGTTACAFGWATTIPEFQTAGLRLVVGQLDFGRAYVTDGLPPMALGESTGTFGWRTSISSAMRFFDLTESEALEIFSDERQFNFQPTPGEIACIIREMVQGQQIDI